MNNFSKRILIAEDEKPLARALSLKLEIEGYITEIVANGEEVREKLLTNKYDLILMDLMMPKIDGFAVLDELKANGIKTPVIIMSNLGQDTDQIRATQSGAIAYFVKSDIKLFEVVDFIKKTLNL